MGRGLGATRQLRWKTSRKMYCRSPDPHGIPSPDGKVSGVVAFLAHHETYHVGQTAYLRCYLGHEGVAG